MTPIRHRINLLARWLSLFVAVWITSTFLAMGAGFFLLELLESLDRQKLAQPVSDLAFQYIGEVGVGALETWKGRPLDLQYNPLAGLLAMGLGVIVWMLPVSVLVTAWMVRVDRLRTKRLLRMTPPPSDMGNAPAPEKAAPTC